MLACVCFVVFFFKQKTAYEMRISDWSSDVCSSDLLDSDDTRVMLDALRTLGVDVDSDAAAGRAQIHGCGIFPVKQADLFLGNAGTAFRPLTAALALMGGDYQLSCMRGTHARTSYWRPG